jgi:hypothetical protein
MSQQLEVKTVKIRDIEFDPTIYPRKAGVDSQRVARYAACMRDGEKFEQIHVEPPRDGKYRLLDGLHRINALKEIGAEEVDIIVISLDGENPLLYAARQNRFGKDLTDADAENIAKRVFQENPKVTNKTIALAVGRSEATVSGYLSDLRARHELAQDLKIFKMGLLGIPQERIAQRLGLPRTTIEEHLTKTTELKKSANDLLTHGFSSNTIAEKLGWPEPLVWAVALEEKDDRERFAELKWNIRVWDYWNWGDVDHRFGDSCPGRIPAQLVAHVLYFFTNQGTLVFDPMAGGGVTADVCLALNRRCWSFDKEDRSDAQPEIEAYYWKPGALQWPVNGKARPDLIFFDPPYYKKKEEEYGEDSISALRQPEYLKFFQEWAILAAGNTKPSTRLALLVADWRDFESTAAIHENPQNAVTIFDYVREVSQGGWELTHRIESPLSSERFTGNMVTAMQERRSLGTVSRTLLMFQKASKGGLISERR